MEKLYDIYVKISRQQPEMLNYAMQVYSSMPSAKPLIEDDQYLEVKGLGIVRITYDDLIKAKAESLEYRIDMEARRRAKEAMK